MRELSERLDSNELSEWIAYDNLYGLADGYFVAAIVAEACLRPHLKKGRSVTPADFIPYFREAAHPRQTTADHRRLFERLASRGKPESA